MNEDMPLEIGVGCVGSIAVLALVWPDSVVGSARQSSSDLPIQFHFNLTSDAPPALPSD
jgi:hypothetical protein